VPTPQRFPFLCHLTFTASGHEQGDIVQVGNIFLKHFYFLFLFNNGKGNIHRINTTIKNEFLPHHSEIEMREQNVDFFFGCYRLFTTNFYLNNMCCIIQFG
jgi:hypothetical protein